jgi:hypothetical protein
MNGKKTPHRNAVAERLFKDVAVADQLKGTALASEEARRATNTAKTIKLRALRKAGEAAEASKSGKDRKPRAR